MSNKKENKYYNIRRMLSYTSTSFYIVIGGRGAGKKSGVHNEPLFKNNKTIR